MVQTGEQPQTNKHVEMDGHHQMYYLHAMLSIKNMKAGDTQTFSKVRF